MSIPLISDIVPKNDGDFPLVAAQHVSYKDGRLSDYMPIAVTQAEYNALKEAGTLSATNPYLIVEG